MVHGGLLVLLVSCCRDLNYHCWVWFLEGLDCRPELLGNGLSYVLDSAGVDFEHSCDCPCPAYLEIVLRCLLHSILE
jgi:hypothetical protein